MIEHKGILVFKRGKQFDWEWRRKLQEIMHIIDLPAFFCFQEDGYVTRFIDGTDLHGENLSDKLSEEIILTRLQRKRLIKLFKDIVYAGIETGYILADFTKKNIMLHKNNVYLIDFEVIIEGELNQDYINIFQQMLDYLKIDYRFDGDLKKLYERLS